MRLGDEEVVDIGVCGTSSVMRRSEISGACELMGDGVEDTASVSQDAGVGSLNAWHMAMNLTILA